MSTMLDSRDIRMFDYFNRFAQPFREAIRTHAERVAAQEGIEVEYIRKPKGFRKEDRIWEILAKRGSHPGLVHVFSTMELCSSYRPWHDKKTGMTHLRQRRRQVRSLLLLLHRQEGSRGVKPSFFVSLPSHLALVARVSIPRSSSSWFSAPCSILGVAGRSEGTLAAWQEHFVPTSPAQSITSLHGGTNDVRSSTTIAIARLSSTSLARRS
jgi:hypothetical protein